MRTFALAIIFTVFAHGATKENQKRLREVLDGVPNVKDAFIIQKSKAGTRYFVTTFGPCTCVTDNLYATCVKDLSSKLQEALKKSNEDAKVECHPFAGCTQGMRTVYVECSNGFGDSLTNF